MSNNQELVMETTHGRAKKCKTEFKAVLNKVLVSGLVLATMLGTATPAFAATIESDINGVSNNIVSEYGVSVESAIQNIRNTIQAIENMKANGSVSDSQIKELASQLYSLETAVKTSGSGVTSEIMHVISSAEDAIQGLSNVSEVEVALAVVRENLGIVAVGTNVVSNKAATTSQQNALKSFDDVTQQNLSWAYKEIMAMAQNGYIGGTKAPDANGVGHFEPNAQITVDQFTAIAVRWAYPDEVAAASGDWSSQARQVAIAHKIIGANEFQGQAFKNPITRQEMTMIMIRCLESKDIKTYSNINGVKSELTDYDSIGGGYKDYVAKAYTMGIMKGVGNGVFSPNSNATRAQAAVILYRCIDENNRQDVDFTVVTPPSENTAGAITITEGQTRSNRPAKAGDTVIKSDGTKVTLKLGPNGVLGEGQGVAADLGLQSKNGNWTVKANEVFNCNDYGKDSTGHDYRSQTYYINPLTGEGHWGAEWSVINQNNIPNYDGKQDFEISNDKNYVWVNSTQEWYLIAFNPELIE